MTVSIIENKLKQYQIQSKQDEMNALKEIFQELALAALSRGDFFKHAAFQGGTCLRICYGLQRFSEDLDFILQNPNPNFIWQPYLEKMREEFSAYDLNLETQDRSKVNNNVKKAFIKEDSFGQILNLAYKRNVSDTQKIQIKLEIDINPPKGSLFERTFLDFPFLYAITQQNLPSLFSGKCHALLCRTYTKGRDWFDFIWYVTQKTKLNYSLLQESLNQTGPFEGRNLIIEKNWIITELKRKIHSINWDLAKNDVSGFLKAQDQESLKLWSTDFFSHFVEKLGHYL